jgi:hypothetical protein
LLRRDRPAPLSDGYNGFTPASYSPATVLRCRGHAVAALRRIGCRGRQSSAASAVAFVLDYAVMIGATFTALVVVVVVLWLDQ